MRKCFWLQLEFLLVPHLCLCVDGCGDARLRNLRQIKGDGGLPEIILGSDNKKRT